jgi:hypothetical protein
MQVLLYSLPASSFYKEGTNIACITNLSDEITDSSTDHSRAASGIKATSYMLLNIPAL